MINVSKVRIAPCLIHSLNKTTHKLKLCHSRYNVADLNPEALTSFRLLLCFQFPMFTPRLAIIVAVMLLRWMDCWAASKPGLSHTCHRHSQLSRGPLLEVLEKERSISIQLVSSIPYSPVLYAEEGEKSHIVFREYCKASFFALATINYWKGGWKGK